MYNLLKLTFMNDFSICYGDFKGKLSVTQFISELKKIGGILQIYGMLFYLDGKLLSEHQYDGLDRETSGKVTEVVDNEDYIEVRFYNYHGQARGFFEKFGFNHDNEIRKQIYNNNLWKICL